MKRRDIITVGVFAACVYLSGCAAQPKIKPAPANPRPAQTLPQPQSAATPGTASPAPAPAMTAEQRAAAAIANAKSAVAREPMNWRVFNDLGVVYYGQGMYDQAIAAFQQALALHPITSTLEAEAKVEEAQAAHRAALEAKRQADIERAKAQQSQQEMNQLLGMVFSVAGASGGAGAQNLQMMQPVLESLNNASFATPDAGVPQLSPEMKAESSLKSKREIATIYANLGMAYFGKKSYPDAVAALDNVVQLDPSRTDVLKTSADAQYRLCKYDQCIQTLTRYHAIAPVEPATMLLLSEAFHALGMEPESNKVFASFLARQNATDPGKLMELGTLCLTHCRYAEAAGFLAKARQADQPPAGAHRLPEAPLTMMEAEAQFSSSQPEKAAALLTSIAQPRAEPRAWYMLARAYDEMGDNAKALEAYQKAVEAFGSAAPSQADNYIYVCRTAAGDEDAIKSLERSLTGVPLTPGGGAEQWCLLGFAYEKSGRIREAMEILNRCQAANPAYSKVGMALARLSKQTATARDQALAEAEAATQGGDKVKALAGLTDAYRLTAAGKQKEEIRSRMLRLAAGMDPAPALTDEAQDHYLRGNAALKAAKTPMDLGRSLSEFQWAVYYSPWVADLYFSTSAVKSLQNRNAAAASDLKLYLTGKPNATNMEGILNRLYEVEYQREQKLRELESAAAF